MTRPKYTVSQFLFSNVHWEDSKVINGQGSNMGHKELGEIRNSVSLRDISKLGWKLAELTVRVHYWLHIFFCFKVEVKVGKSWYTVNSTKVSEFNNFF